MLLLRRSTTARRCCRPSSVFTTTGYCRGLASKHSGSSLVRWGYGDGVATLYLNNPDKLNALTVGWIWLEMMCWSVVSVFLYDAIAARHPSPSGRTHMCFIYKKVPLGGELGAVMREVRNHTYDLRAVVLTGEGKAFSVRACVRVYIFFHWLVRAGGEKWRRTTRHRPNPPTGPIPPIRHEQAGGDLAWLEERRRTDPQHNVEIMRGFYNVRAYVRACVRQFGRALRRATLVPMSIVLPLKHTHFHPTTHQLFLAVRQLPVPVISAINGPAIGAGLCLAMATDLRVAAKYVRAGVVGGLAVWCLGAAHSFRCTRTCTCSSI